MGCLVVVLALPMTMLLLFVALTQHPVMTVVTLWVIWVVCRPRRRKPTS